MNILDKILKVKLKELEAFPAVDSNLRNNGPLLLDSLRSKHPSLIAEIKPKSPSAGVLIQSEEIPQIVQAYNAHAQAISVLCDSVFFGGSYELLASVRAQTELPILAKEFIIDPRQIDRGLSSGANSVLLIAAILDPATLESLLNYALEKNLDVIVEVHDTDDTKKALLAYQSLAGDQKSHIAIGINNRNLRTLSIDLYTTVILSRFIHEETNEVPFLIAESGIDQPADVQLLMPHVQGFLVGTSLLRAQHIEDRIQQLFHAS